ncbi:hypothetical protein [Deinococcus ficus]|uniref:Uncharacterized protein n=1 Tax=Deinococcus ficus TaxID=317577 RepID=A0A221ST55_9DEIO|nr:hypothetical protein [Deinococcus ficus]ASN79815.1 hypothetical protein DFI_01260 [Deinococcus ficus]
MLPRLTPPPASPDHPVQRDTAASATRKVRASASTSLLARWSAWHPTPPQAPARPPLRLDLP